MLSLRALRLAVVLKLRRWFGFPDPLAAASPAGLALSPSARHFADYESAPLALAFASRKSHAVQWQVEARAKLAELCGYRRTRAAPRIVASTAHRFEGGGERLTHYLHVRDGVDIPIHLIAPSARGGLLPVMICLQGTNSGAHLSWGEVRYPADLEREHGDIARQAAARGYLAVAVEQIGFGERTERRIIPRSSAPCVDATMHALLLGRCLLGERCSDISAVVDWLLDGASAPAIDPDRIHIMGHSAGGSAALFAAALDTRISAVLACGCVDFIRASIGRRRDNQGQNVIPGILNWMELDDIVGLVAPRPFASVAGDGDAIWPARGALAVGESARAVYRALGSEQRIVIRTAPGGHRFRPALSWEALEQASKI